MTRKLVWGAAVLVTGVIVVVMWPQVPLPERVVSFEKALGSGNISVSAHRGEQCGEAVLIITNNSSEAVALSIPVGLVLASAQAREPDMVMFRLDAELKETDDEPAGTLLVEEELGALVITAGDRRIFKAAVLSLEFYRDDHSPGAILHTAHIDPLLGHLLATISRLDPGAPRALIQSAVWSLTDGICEHDLMSVVFLENRDLFTIRFWLVHAGLNVDRIPLVAELRDRIGETGEPVYAGVMEARLWSVIREQEVAGVYARSGMEYVLLVVGLKNHGQEIVVVWERNFTLVDSDGRIYDPCLLSGKLSDGFRWRWEMEPDRAYTGVLVFEVPIDTRGIVLRYCDDEHWFECWGL